jgi:hypothetical protein
MRPENLMFQHIAKSMKATEDQVIAMANNPRIAFLPPILMLVNGKLRLITRPRRIWKMAYRWFGDFLRREFPPHPCAHGSVPGRSPFTAASRHLGPRFLLCRDVKDAFPSIKADRFYLQLLALGFSSIIAELLTKLLLPDGYLPQGSPASNAAIDLYFYRVDCEISEKLAGLGARYTRFTDGLDCSFEIENTRIEVEAIVHENLARLGLTVNQKKLESVGWQHVHAERVMSGVRVNSARGTNLPRATLKDLVREVDSLDRGSRTVAPHTIVGLARRRRSVQGWVNQASQADISPSIAIQNRLNVIDRRIRKKLHDSELYMYKTWYVKNKSADVAQSIASKWRERRRFAKTLSSLPSARSACS